jgi:hypothetical protein
LSAAGTLVFSASVSGYDPDLSSTVLASSAVPLTIQPASIPPPPPDFGNPLRLPGPGAALDRNAVDFTRGDVTLVRVHPLSGDPVTVSILTASGRLVRVLGGALDLGAGQFAMVWDGRTDEGRPVARGVYLVRVVGGGLRVTLKVVVRPGSP